jgi:CO/xanthine dehydrogenase Mo-binding subunit
VEPDGTVRVAVGSPAQGQAHRTALGRLVARVLGVRPEAVIVEGGDTALLPKGSGTFGSRTLVVAGTAAAEAAREVRRRALARAARRLRVGPADLETVCGVVLNPDLVEGQVLGAIVNGLGNVLCEHLVYDAQGQLLTATLMDYGLPRAARQPPIVWATRRRPRPPTRWASRGWGRAASSPSPAPWPRRWRTPWTTRPWS